MQGEAMLINACYYALDFNQDDRRGELLADPEEFNEEETDEHSHD